MAFSLAPPPLPLLLPNKGHFPPTRFTGWLCGLEHRKLSLSRGSGAHSGNRTTEDRAEIDLETHSDREKHANRDKERVREEKVLERDS